MTTQFTIHGLSYQRNGVGGEGFYTVDFFLEEPYESCARLIAVIPASLRTYDMNNGDVPCFVIDPTNPLESKWRGDTIAAGLIDAGLWQRIDADDEARWQTFLTDRQNGK